jgi:NADH dehydrogenase
MKKIAVLGGSGFVGSAMVNKLSESGYCVQVLTRHRETSKHLILIPNVNVVECDVMNNDALKLALNDCDAVINLIGILHESRKVTFKKIHADFPKSVANVCASIGIHRLIQMSALQANIHAPSAYLRSKGLGEALLLNEFKALNVTIFRPSIIFGRGDGFINLFAKLIQILPVILLAKPNAKFQPIYVEDVAAAFVAAIENSSTYGKSYDLAGPKVYTLIEIIRFVSATLKKKRVVIGLNNLFSYMQAFAMEMLPIKLMTRDNIKSMEVDSTSAAPFPEFLKFRPVPMESVVPDYLLDENPRNTYNRYRSLAGR